MRRVGVVGPVALVLGAFVVVVVLSFAAGFVQFPGSPSVSPVAVLPFRQAD